MAILGDTSVISLQSIGNVTVDGTTRLNNQLVVQTVTNGTYNEGIRINKSGNNYATFLLGGNAETVSGAPNVNGGWWVSTNPSNQFVISNETSSTSTASLWINTDKTVNIGKASITTLNSVTVGSSPKFTDANVTSTKTALPSSATNYYLVGSATEATNTAGLVKFGFDARFYMLNGTASAEGKAQICLGNQTASGTAGNSTGGISLYNNKGKYGHIAPHADDTSNRVVYIPKSDGTLVVHTTDTKIGDTNLPVYITADGVATAVTNLDASKLSGTIPSSCYTNTEYSNFKASGTNAAAGLVPSPGTTAGTTKYLREDATWQIPPDENVTTTKITYPSSTTNYYMVASSTDVTNTGGLSKFGTDARIQVISGTTSREGVTEIIIGNATATGTAGNTTGKLCLYNAKGKYQLVVPHTTATSNYTVTTPGVSGEMVVHTAGSKTGDTNKPVYIATTGAATAVTSLDATLLSGTIPTSCYSSNAVMITGDQTITGYKTIENQLAFNRQSFAKGTVPSADIWPMFNPVLETGTGTAIKNRLAAAAYYVDTTGNSSMELWAYKNVANGTDYAKLGIRYPKTGDPVGFAPTPPATSNTTDIATTAWVRTYASPTGHTHNYAGSASAGGPATSVAIEAGTTDSDRYVWFSYSGAGNEGRPVYDADFKYNPSTNNLTVTKINGVALGSTPKFTDTTYTGANGISLSGTTFSNSGVRSIATGSANGTISVNTNGTAADVAVKGLGSNAYSSTSYLPLAGGAMTGVITSSVNKSISLSRSGSSDECFVAHAKRTDTTHEIQFGIGSGGTNRGIWDSKKGDWILYRDADGNSYLQSNGTSSKEFKVDTTGYGYLATPPIRDNTTKVATTAFVWANAARHISAATTIYVSSTAAGNASGSSAANAMSISDFQVYVAAARINYSTSSLTNSRTLTVCFVPTGTSYGDFYIDDTKMPGVKNLTITTSTGTNSTTDNYTTNSPVFSNIYVRGHLMVTIKNVTVTGVVQALYGADVTMVTFIDATKFYAAYWGILRFTAGTYQIHNAGRDYLFQAAQGGRIYINANNTYFHFAEQCYYTGAIFQCDLQCYLYIYYSYLRWTGPKPVVAITSSGTINGTSPTAAATAEKTLAYDAFELVSGATVLMKFAENNTAENPTLNVNGTGAIPIYFGSEPIPASYLGTYVQYKFTYDGTNYVCNNTLLRLDYVTAGGWLTTSGNYNQTYKSGDWNWTGWSHYYVNGANIGGTIYATTFSGNSSTTTKLATARAIDGVTFDGSAARIHYGTCSTKNSTVAKVVACTGYTLVTGSRIIVNFTVTNTANSPTLNVNSTGAKAIQYRGAAINKDWLEANRTYEFVYDGTNYQLIGDINTDTVYTHPTPVTAGTAGTSSATSGITLDVPYVTYNGDGHVTASGTHTHTVSNFIKSGSTAAAGLVPAPSTTAGTTKFLCEDATWKVPPDADTLTTARAIDGVSFDGSAAIVHYGTCGTAAGTAAKTVACTSYTLVTGSRIIVKFTVTNTAASPTLNVNSTGAKAIQYRGAAITAGNLAANRTYEFIYDGSAYQLVGDIDTVYTHPTGAGNNHIPSGGSSGQILTWSSAGTAAWANAPASGATLKIYS